MSTRTQDAFVYSPADLGFNAVAVGIGLTVNGLVIPWRRSFRIHNIAWRMFWTDVGALTVDLMIARFSDAGVQNTQTAILHQGATNIVFGGNGNNYGMVSRYTLQEGSVGSGVIPKTGTATVSVGLAFECPYIRFSIRNNGAVAIADMSLEATVFE